METTLRPWRLVRAPDAEEEAREAVRTIREVLASGASLERMAVVAMKASPYLLLLHERLSAAGIDHHGRVPISTPRTMEERFLEMGEPGRGVFVGSLEDLAALGEVVESDLVVLLGLVEGLQPRSSQLGALSGAERLVLSTTRVDTRAGREVGPSRWWVAALAEVVGSPVWASAVGEVDHPDFRDIPSFQAALETASNPADETEERVAQLLSVVRASGPEAAADSLSSIDVRSARAVSARDDRASGRASPWTGFVGPLPADAPGAVGGSPVGSPTRFERWATCPLRFFLTHVLGVTEPEEERVDRALSDRDRGSMVHEVLERFHGADLHRGAGAPFASADAERLEQLVGEVGSLYSGAEGDDASVLWTVERDAIIRRLEAALMADGTHRAQREVEPFAVEHDFGFEGGAPPVRVELSDGRSVAFRGKVDRVDASVSGEKVVVIDYKTGSDRDYTALPKAGRGPVADITCSGRHLQLPVYAEAARQLVPSDGPQEVEAYFWFLDGKTTASLRGGPVGQPERDRLREVLEQIVGGIGAGQFPANPGEDGWFGPENCGRCPFDRLCPPSRVDRWESLRAAPEIEGYVELSEGPK